MLRKVSGEEWALVGVGLFAGMIIGYLIVELVLWVTA
jgi:uncharacterized membrane-anchored protein YhcB (DUF1043 family)